jgi:hypothetical protein
MVDCEQWHIAINLTDHLLRHLMKTNVKTKFDWQDPFFLMEEQSATTSARTGCNDGFTRKLQTRVLMAARHEKFDREIMNEAGAMGFWAARSKGATWLRRPELCRLWSGGTESSALTAATAAPSACSHPWCTDSRLRQRSA